MKLRGTATNNLTDVIQMLQMARKTGILTLQREGKGNTVEQGTLTLQAGQIVDAGLGLITGKTAYARLSTWGACHFIFQATAPTSPNMPAPYQLSPEPATGRSGPLPAIGTTGRNETLPVSSVPTRLRDGQEVLGYFDRLGLTRAHRQLFLLINGQYTVQELMRLSGHRADQFERLLTDLEHVGLVRR
jgi:hypothetical protein